MYCHVYSVYWLADLSETALFMLEILDFSEQSTAREEQLRTIWNPHCKKNEACHTLFMSFSLTIISYNSLFIRIYLLTSNKLNLRSAPMASDYTIAWYFLNVHRFKYIYIFKNCLKVMDATQKSYDEAYTALHDCDNDPNRAVNLLIEGIEVRIRI